jgi:hypothetical protein
VPSGTRLFVSNKFDNDISPSQGLSGVSSYGPLRMKLQHLELAIRHALARPAQFLSREYSLGHGQSMLSASYDPTIIFLLAFNIDAVAQ